MFLTGRRGCGRSRGRGFCRSRGLSGGHGCGRGCGRTRGRGHEAPSSEYLLKRRWLIGGGDDGFGGWGEIKSGIMTKKCDRSRNIWKTMGGALEEENDE